MPKHNFILDDITLNEDSIDLSSYSWDKDGNVYKNGLDPKSNVSIDDDLILYINDSLNWIQIMNPRTQSIEFGLNYYGITFLKEKTELNSLRNIINSWINLFDNAPNNILLTGEFFVIEGSNELGKYEKLEFNKSELLASLKKLLYITDKALKEDKCIIHFGI